MLINKLKIFRQASEKDLLAKDFVKFLLSFTNNNALTLTVLLHAAGYSYWVSIGDIKLAFYPFLKLTTSFLGKIPAEYKQSLDGSDDTGVALSTAKMLSQMPAGVAADEQQLPASLPSTSASTNLHETDFLPSESPLAQVPSQSIMQSSQR